MRLRNALDGQNIEEIAQEIHRRHDGSTGPYKLLCRIPYLRRLAEWHGKQTLAYITHTTALQAVHILNESGEERFIPIQHIILSHVHKTCHWTQEYTRALLQPPDKTETPDIINTGTAGGRTMSGIANFVAIQDEKPTFYEAYNPKHPDREVTKVHVDELS